MEWDEEDEKEETEAEGDGEEPPANWRTLMEFLLFSLFLAHLFYFTLETVSTPIKHHEAT